MSSRVLQKCYGATKSMMQGPKRVVSVLLSAIVLSTGYLDYWAYSQAFYKEPNIWMDVVWGTGSAPSQYRIGVIDTAYFLARHLHVGMRHTLALLDVISGMIAVFALFLVLQRSAVYRKARVATQWFGAASLIILVQFYLAWLLWYQRPETLPTAAILALALLLVAVKPPGPESGRAIAAGTVGTAGIVLGLLLLAMAQGFIRADVAFALHLGILLVCMTSAGKGFALPRGVQAGTSMVAMLLALGIFGFRSVSSLSVADGLDCHDADAEAVSGGVGRCWDIYRSGDFPGDVGGGGEDRRGADLPPFCAGARAGDGGVGDAAVSVGRRIRGAGCGSG